MDETKQETAEVAAGRRVWAAVHRYLDARQDFYDGHSPRRGAVAMAILDHETRELEDAIDAYDEQYKPWELPPIEEILARVNIPNVPAPR